MVTYELYETSMKHLEECSTIAGDIRFMYLFCYQS